jgi:hypothetical protein
MEVIKYKKEIDEMLDSLKENWMSDEDFKEFKDQILILYPYQKLEKDIEIGIKNGYSVEKQLTLLKIFMSKN